MNSLEKIANKYKNYIDCLDFNNNGEVIQVVLKINNTQMSIIKEFRYEGENDLEYAFVVDGKLRYLPKHNDTVARHQTYADVVREIDTMIKENKRCNYETRKEH